MREWPPAVLTNAEVRRMMEYIRTHRDVYQACVSGESAVVERRDGRSGRKRNWRKRAR